MLTDAQNAESLRLLRVSAQALRMYGALLADEGKNVSAEDAKNVARGVYEHLWQIQRDADQIRRDAEPTGTEPVAEGRVLQTVMCSKDGARKVYPETFRWLDDAASPDNIIRHSMRLFRSLHGALPERFRLTQDHARQLAEHPETRRLFCFTDLSNIQQIDGVGALPKYIRGMTVEVE